MQGRLIKDRIIHVQHLHKNFQVKWYGHILFPVY